MEKLPSISKKVRWDVSPTDSMSVVRKHFWTVVRRLCGGCACPMKYGLKGTMPALVNSRVGSPTGTSGALGSRR
ncbi:hypothetical protein HRbin24_00659 [bacterium HR24]|nr:hypothetical protein HRbin24_00659 [bacterium HR24]